MTAQKKSSRQAEQVARASQDGSPIGVAIVLAGLAVVVLNPDKDISPIPIVCTATMAAGVERLLRYRKEEQARKDSS